VIIAPCDTFEFDADGAFGGVFADGVGGLVGQSVELSGNPQLAPLGSAQVAGSK
jgi:hypothetical protein